MSFWESIGNFFYNFGAEVVTLPRLICFGALVIGYFFGHIEGAYIICKFKKVDIYSAGSGNPGTTNMWRVLGPGWGLLTFVIDIGKVAAAIYLNKYIFLSLLQLPIDPIAMTLYTGLGAVLGHDFPVLLKGKGGKGVASTAAVFIFLGEWKYIILGVAVFIIFLLITKYVSLTDIILIIVMMLAFFLFTLINWTYIEPAWLTDCHIIVAILAILNIVAHRQNIVRLAYGEENKIRLGRSKEETEYEEYEEEEEEVKEAADEETAEEEAVKEPAVEIEAAQEETETAAQEETEAAVKEKNAVTEEEEPEKEADVTEEEEPEKEVDVIEDEEPELTGEMEPEEKTDMPSEEGTEEKVEESAGEEREEAAGTEEEPEEATEEEKPEEAGAQQEAVSEDKTEEISGDGKKTQALKSKPVNSNKKHKKKKRNTSKKKKRKKKH